MSNETKSDNPINPEAIKDVGVRYLYPSEGTFCPFVPPIEVQSVLTGPESAMRQFLYFPCVNRCQNYDNGECMVASKRRRFPKIPLGVPPMEVA